MLGRPPAGAPDGVTRFFAWLTCVETAVFAGFFAWAFGEHALWRAAKDVKEDQEEPATEETSPLLHKK